VRLGNFTYHYGGSWRHYGRTLAFNQVFPLRLPA
jgi:hypothetical protein